MFSGKEHLKVFADSENGTDLVFKKFVLDIVNIFLRH